jgi:hypothetical protein
MPILAAPHVARPAVALVQPLQRARRRSFEESRVMGELREGSFYPFLDGIGDFDLDEFAERLHFKPLQKELFYELIKQLEIKIWFSASADSPDLALDVFWFDHHVSGLNLFDLLKCSFAIDGDGISFESEIEALNKFKVIIDHAIELRRGRDET